MDDQLERLKAALADRYTVQHALGRGGMATVYRAHDLKHDRPVALKVLKGELAAAIGSDRFLREITLTGRFDHPHILPLLDSGEAAGFLYYVMPYVEGESLRDRLNREKQLSLEEALQIAREVADALSYAHSRGIVHRDIKPENILLATRHARVADFGIARAVTAAGSESLTETGLAVGTPAYMSPEQAVDSEAVDARSDLYSLGCMLYEMLAGQPPFTGPTVESIVHQHIAAAPPNITIVRPTVPAPLAATLHRTLAKTPADRYATVAEFARALESGTSGSAQALPAGSPVRRWWGVAARSPVTWVVGLTVVVGLMVWGNRGPTRAPHMAEEGSIAVLPFVNMSPDPEQDFFSDGLTEEILNVLARVPGLRVPARTSSFYFKGKNVPMDSIARLLRVAHVLEGSVRKAGNRIRVTAQLIEVESGYHLWSDTYDRDLDDIFVVQNQIARSVVNALRVTLPGHTGERLVSQRTASTEAYNQYLLGRYHWNRRGRVNIEVAIKYFERAIDLDSNYASAYAGLADAFSVLGYYQYMPVDEAFTRAARAARQALDLDPDNPDAHVAFAYVELHYGWSWDRAEAAFRRALELNPGSADAHRFFALFHAAMGRLDASLAEATKAVELDPVSPITHRGLGRHHYFRGEYDEALARQEKALEIEANFFPALFLTGQIYMLRGQYDAALDVLSRAESLEPGSPIIAALLAHLAGKTGREEEARQRLGALESSRTYADGSAYWVAIAWLGLGDVDRAIEWLERSYHERSSTLPYIAVEPLLHPLHGDRRFDRLLERMGLPPVQ